MTGKETEILTGDELMEELGKARELPQTKFDRVVLITTTIIFCVMIGLVMSQVLIRYLTVHFGVTLHWTEEIARYLLIITAFFGSASAWRKRENITISALTEMMPTKIKVPLDLFKDITIFVFSLFCAYSSYKLGLRMMPSPLGSIYAIKMGHIYLVLCFAFILITIYMVRWIIVRVQDVIKEFFSGGVTDKADKAGVVK